MLAAKWKTANHVFLQQKFGNNPLYGHDFLFFGLVGSLGISSSLCQCFVNLLFDALHIVFAQGFVFFGVVGSIERVTAKVFLLSPQDVDVTAEDKARIREGGFFNQS